MKRQQKLATSFTMLVGVILFTACGGGGGSSESGDVTSATKIGYFIDAPVKNLHYETRTQNGVTDAQGRFKYKEGEEVTLKIGKVVLGRAKPDVTRNKLTPKLLAKNDTALEAKILRLLQSADSDNNTSNGITLNDTTVNAFANLNQEYDLKDLSESEILDLNPQIKNELDSNNDGQIDVTETEARTHATQSEEEFNQAYDRGDYNSDREEEQNSNLGEENEANGENEGNENEGNENSGGTYTGGGSNTGGNANKYTLTAWNDLGMHCMDGKDFSVFSVLPPYNNLHAQLKDKNGNLVTTGVTITYKATVGTDGKLNTTSSNKTNFWVHAKKLFDANLSADVGLTGSSTPTTTPKPLSFNTTHQWWEAEGIPITPYNDDGSKNYYPLVRVEAKDASGNILASVDTVLPVSDEMDCKKCHASSAKRNDAKPAIGWVNNADSEKDYKLNILRLHDQKQPTAVSDNLVALQAKHYDYNTSGLEATVASGTPVLCTACHKSNALPGVGIGLKSFTAAIHSRHANVVDPNSGLTLNNNANRDSCYACHPGSQTACLRGAMGDAKNADGTSKMQCQSCHGNMSHVGSATREGWLSMPNCQSCHHDGKREITAIDPTTNTLRNAIDTRFATNPDTPAQGFSLYRFSKGHGKLQCEACHGATHAIYPAHEADNKVSIAIQGHSGTIGECSACHTTVPNTITGGPHGMHPVGDSWVRNHENVAENNPAQCKVCHGADYRGSALSATWTNRTLHTGEFGTKNWTKGHKVSCYDCHNGPNGD